MDILPYHFGVCKLFGLWYENSNYFIFKTVWRGIVLFMLLLFNLSQIIELLTGHGGVEESVEVLFTTFTYIMCLLKIFNFILRHDEMCDLLEDFRTPLFQPTTEKERETLKNYNSKITKVFFSYSTLSHCAGFTMLTAALYSYFIQEYNLPFKVYQPYDVTIHRYYWTSYSIQVFAILVGISINTTMDTIGYSFIMLATCQYEIVSSRYRYLTVSIKECIQHQVLVQNVVVKIQKFFITVILPLFSSSLITFCVSIFHISRIDMTSFVFFGMILYLSCMLSQIFLFCWFGNELSLKSREVASTIYESDWLYFNIEDRKSLWLAMITAKKGSNISYHGQFNLSLSTFIWIVKTSYATFNLLKQAS